MADTVPVCEVNTVLVCEEDIVFVCEEFIVLGCKASFPGVDSDWPILKDSFCPLGEFVDGKAQEAFAGRE